MICLFYMGEVIKPEQNHLALSEFERGQYERAKESALKREKRFQQLWMRMPGNRFLHWSVMMGVWGDPPADILSRVVASGIQTRKQLKQKGEDIGGWGAQGEENISVVPDIHESYHYETSSSYGVPLYTIIIDPDKIIDHTKPAEYLGAAEHLNEKIVEGGIAQDALVGLFTRDPNIVKDFFRLEVVERQRRIQEWLDRYGHPPVARRVRIFLLLSYFLEHPEKSLPIYFIQSGEGSVPYKSNIFDQGFDNFVSQCRIFPFLER